MTRRKPSMSPLLNSLDSTVDMAKLKQLTKSSDAAPTSILKSQASRQTSDLRSSDNDDLPYMDPIFSLRQRRYVSFTFYSFVSEEERKQIQTKKMHIDKHAIY